MTSTTSAAGRDRVSGEALLTSLRRPTSHESVAAQVCRHVLAAGLQPGDRLPSEGELAAAISASRLSVREGLRALEALGLVEARVGSGWYLRPFDVSTAARTFAWSLAFHPTALLDLLAVRRATEADIVEALAGHLAEGDLEVLDDLVDRMQWRASRGRLILAEDREFHTRLFAASGNQVALALMDFYWDVMAALHQQGFPGPSAEALPQVAETHAAIADALRRGDGEAARRLLRASHHDEAQRRFTSWLASQDAGQADGAVPVIRSAVHTALLGREARNP
jgi:DNA-binding FadR family transcriptional regulator